MSPPPPIVLPAKRGRARRGEYFGGEVVANTLKTVLFFMSKPRTTQAFGTGNMSNYIGMLSLDDDVALLVFDNAAPAACSKRVYEKNFHPMI